MSNPAGLFLKGGYYGKIVGTQAHLHDVIEGKFSMASNAEYLTGDLGFGSFSQSESEVDDDIGIVEPYAYGSIAHQLSPTLESPLSDGEYEPDKPKSLSKSTILHCSP